MEKKEEGRKVVGDMGGGVLQGGPVLTCRACWGLVEKGSKGFSEGGNLGVGAVRV